MMRDDLFGHYQQHYGPSNAVIVAVGNFATDDLLRRIEGHFGDKPACSSPASLAEREPPQAEARRVALHHPGPFPVLMLGHHVPERAHADCAALLVLNALLSGPPSGPFGGGGTLRTSRLYQRFVASGIAASVGADVGVNIDPSLPRILVVLHPGGAPEPIQQSVLDELQINTAAIAAELKQHLPVLVTTRMLTVLVESGMGREEAHKVLAEPSRQTLLATQPDLAMQPDIDAQSKSAASILAADRR